MVVAELRRTVLAVLARVSWHLEWFDVMSLRYMRGFWCRFLTKIFLKKVLPELSIILCALTCWLSNVARVTSVKAWSFIFTIHIKHHVKLFRDVCVLLWYMETVLYIPYLWQIHNLSKMYYRKSVCMDVCKGNEPTCALRWFDLFGQNDEEQGDEMETFCLHFEGDWTIPLVSARQSTATM